MTEKEIMDLQAKAKRIRYLTMDCIGTLGVGHVGGSLSIAEVLAVLYTNAMNVDPKNPKMEGRDRLVLSKGHAGPALYATLANEGFFPLEELHTLNKPGTNLPSHCDMRRTPGIDMTTGSLGQGFSCAVGVAIGSKVKKDNATIYAIVGDGESDEGLIWEAGMTAAQYKLDNLIAFTDYNRMQIDGTTDEVIGFIDLKAKWESFGFTVYSIDGHDVEAIDAAIKLGKKNRGSGKPTMIILNTIKGKGVTYAEKMGVGSHNFPIDAKLKEEILNELK